MEKSLYRHLKIIIGIMLVAIVFFIICPSEQTIAGEYDGLDLATAILANQSTLISSYYEDKDTSGTRQSIVLSSLGTMVSTDGSTFILLSTGAAGSVPATTNGYNPGDERGTWFRNKYGKPRDYATLTMVLEVPPYMHYLYYDVQFFSSEYPEFVGSQYNDKFTATVDSLSKGVSEYVIDVNSGYFVLDSNSLTGTGFDIFATSGNPGEVDWVSTTPNSGADAGATDLVPIGGEFHPVSPGEQITITFNIKDTGDNLFDSTVFIDNLVFSGYAKTEMVARKTLQDLNEELLECGDIVKYTVTISNTGTADQADNLGNEFEDFIPDNTTYISGSATATSGTISYDGGENKITWNGAIPAESSVAITFEVTVNESLANGAIVSNQGTVYYDSTGECCPKTNDATELTDDPSVDDGIDRDGDWDTDDDDPTTITVVSYEPPSELTEDFSDDAPGGNATQTYYLYNWFETTSGNVGSSFEVASSYYYSTPQSFKTQLRSSLTPQCWYYNLSPFDGDIEWWEIWFACGNASESSDLLLDFKNNNENDIAKIKFEYIHEGTDPLTDYVAKLYYWNPSSGWSVLASDHQDGYLFNGWYKLRIEKNGTNNINYLLYQAGKGLVGSITAGRLNSPFSNLKNIEWYSTKNPVICPMFFWDEHKIGLTII